jgi:hypothetical protein
MVWEGMRRVTWVKKWTSHRRYWYEYGERQNRREYTWREMDDRWYKIWLTNMELKVGGSDEIEGELVGIWKGNEKSNWKQGSLYIKHVDGIEDERKRWEIMIILSSRSLIEHTSKYQ